MTNWVILLVVAVWTLGALTFLLLWTYTVRRTQPPEDYRA